MAVNLKEQLMPGTFEWTIDYLVNKTDMSMFEKKYNNDEREACAYPPRALLKIILYCYSRGIITSRQIEKACRDSIIIKAFFTHTFSIPINSSISRLFSALFTVGRLAVKIGF